MATIQSKKFTFLDVYLGLICIFPITNILAEGSPVNKIMFVLLLAFHVGMLLLYPLKRTTLYLLYAMLAHYLFVIFNTKYPLYNANLLAYYPFFLMYTYFANDRRDSLMQWFALNKKIVVAVINIWTVVVGFSIFIPSCYYVKEGGTLYFGSFCRTIFRLGPAAVFIQVLSIIAQVLYKKKFAVVYNLIPMYCYFMGSSRTYLVVGICVFIISWYIFCSNRKVFWGSIIPIFAVLLAVLGASAMAEKIKFTLDENQYGDFWFRITSSRSLIWEECISAWKEQTLLKKIFGAGLGFTYDVANRWAHNDFVEILCSAGVLGLIQYLNSIRLLYRATYTKVQIPFVIKACLFMTWFFNAAMNMHYVYFCATLCYPFLLFTVRKYLSEASADNGFVRTKVSDHIVKE